MPLHSVFVVMFLYALTRSALTCLAPFSLTEISKVIT